MFKTKMRYAVLGGAAVMAVSLPASADGFTARAVANLTNNCYTCHGPAGKSPGTIPSLSKLSASRIASDMKEFASGEKKSTVMGRMAKAYTYREIEVIARFIADTNAPAAAAK